ncbi:MAG: triose-phosphate isomerase [Acidimicrobiia bacterium]|nr:triose-phosphate isomerase [Acidimicrobiia bacterium]MDH5289449.1 triose-phosphate isomerase [Acidimicrobiia bacterium]
MSTRKPLISGNWKMNLNHFEALKLVQQLSYEVTKDDVEAVDISVHPPFTDLRTVQTALESDRIPFALGAQHCHFEASGAFTGEVSSAMLAKLGVAYVIAGHSERRELFGETDELVNAKVKAILANGMTPILCVGETLAEREAGEAEAKVERQVAAGLGKVAAEQVAALVVAYEPIWAIGTGRTASADDAQAMCAVVRATVARVAGEDAASTVRVQYGGSVKGENAAELMAQPDIDGALVGGASLEAGSFARIIQYRLH